jgi:hypothetical protein
MRTMVEIELMNSECFQMLEDPCAYVSRLARFIPQRTLERRARLTGPELRKAAEIEPAPDLTHQVA